MSSSDFTSDVAAAGRLIPRGASVEQLVALVTTGPSGSGTAGAGSFR